MEMRPLEVARTTNGSTVALSLTGELDISSAAEVEKALLEAEGERPKVLVVDLRPLSFIDSTGLRLILSADARARRDARRLVVVPGPERVHRVFLVTLLDKRLEFIDDPSELLEGSS
jgi:anti-sigma B factor antagonist